MYNKRSFGITVSCLLFLSVVALVIIQESRIGEQAVLEQRQLVLSPKTNPKFRANPANLPLDIQFENPGYGANEAIIDKFFKPHDGLALDDIAVTSEQRYKAISPAIITQKYHPMEMTIFENKQILENLSRCNEVQIISKNVECTKTTHIDAALNDIVMGLNRTRPWYFDDLLGDIPNQLQKNTVNGYWFRFGGASAWLAEYGVHFFASRVLYSAEKKKGDPLISFIYVQIFDSDWNELKGVTLKVPNGKVYVEMSFPSILPVKFWYHNDQSVRRGYFGPEDPRIILVRNKLGYEEPFLFFNMVKRKGGNDNGDSNQFRTMYGFFPYSQKMIEFAIPGAENIKNQKNWTPIEEGLEEGYHRTLSFVYRYNSLQILQCDLDTGACEFWYKLDPTMSLNDDVGSLRGGTSLIPLPTHKSIKLSAGKRLWIGFARANLVNCGCGQKFYRPNLVILQQIGGTLFEISHVSGFSGFNIEMTGWNVGEKACAFQSVLIPTGISYWEINDEGEKIEDYLGLTVSVSDSTVELLHVKGLLEYILSLPGILDEPEADSIHPGPDNVLCAIENSKEFCKAFAEESP